MYYKKPSGRAARLLLMIDVILRNVVLQAMSAGRVADAVDDEPVVIEVVTLGNIRQMTAGGQVEHLALLVADEGIRA